MNLIKIFYIVIDEEDKIWFKFFSEVGYNLFFVEDFSD